MTRIERLAIGLTVIGIGITPFLGLPPAWWPAMPPLLVHLGIGFGGMLVLVGLYLASTHPRAHSGSPPGYLERRIKKMWPQYLMTLSGIGFFVGLIAFLQLNVAPPSKEGPTDNSSAEPSRPTAPSLGSSSTPNPSGIRKYVFEGLVKARDDLLQIKKDDLSCEALAAWQARADTATRLAHANGIGVHNPISQHVGACRGITDIELLDAIRMSIVQLLNQGIQAAGS